MDDPTAASVADREEFAAPDPATEPATQLVLNVPVRGLVVLIGASGAGKSTFARRHFAPTEVLSSDAFRALVSDDEGDQTATPAAFDLLGRALAHRLRRGRLSVVDATNVKAGDRRQLVRLAVLARRPSVAIVLDPPDWLCQERNAAREGRVVDPRVVTTQLAGVRRTLSDPQRLLDEGFALVHVIGDPVTADALRVVRDAAIPRPDSVPQVRLGPTRPTGSAPRRARTS